MSRLTGETDGLEAIEPSFMLGDWERAMASDTDTLKWVTNWALPLIGRQDEAIVAYRELESRPLPGTIRDLMRACREAARLPSRRPGAIR